MDVVDYQNAVIMQDFQQMVEISEGGCFRMIGVDQHPVGPYPSLYKFGQCGIDVSFYDADILLAHFAEMPTRQGSQHGRPFKGIH